MIENTEPISEMDKDELIEQLLARDYTELNKMLVAIDQLRSDAGPYKMLLCNYQSLRASRDLWKSRAMEYEKLAKRNSEWCDELVDQIRDSFTEYKAALEAYEYIRKYADEMCVQLPCDANGIVWNGSESRYVDDNGTHFLDGLVWNGKQWRIFTVSCNGVNYSTSVDPSTVMHERKDSEEMGVTESVADIFNKVDWSEHGGNIRRRKVLDALYEIGINVEEFNHGRGIWH